MQYPNREQVIKMLSQDEVYNVLDLELFYDDTLDKYPSIYDILHVLGIHEQEIDQILPFSLEQLSTKEN